MNTKKVLLGSLVLASVVSSCTNDEIVNIAQNDAMLSERTQVNLTLTAPSMGSRMAQTETGSFTYTKNDVVGAVLVDAGYSNETSNYPTNNVWNNVDWTVVEGHVGNNRWAFNEEENKFMTEGTTSVGSWLFYTKYNAEMTTTRKGVTFGFPQIQDGAADYSKVYNNNVNFMISPVAHIDGYEGQNLEFDIPMVSVHSYLKMPFNFKALENVTKVQKIIVTAKDDNNNAVSFPTKYVVKNVNLPEAKLSLAGGAIGKIACVDHNKDGRIDLTDMNKEMSNQADLLQYQKYSGENKEAEWKAFQSTDYVPFVEGLNDELDKLVVDFESNHDDEATQNGGLDVKNGLFDAWMLMPAGVYSEIAFEIYTNDGVYSVTVSDRNAYRENANEGLVNTDPAYINAVGEGLIFLRPNKQVTISDVEAVVTAGEVEYIKVTEKNKTTGKFVTKTSDLINFINGIKEVGNYNIYTLTQSQIGENNGVDDAVLPEHKLIIINQAVMTAVETKEAALQGDIQLTFKDAEIVIEGNEEDALDIHDLTFEKNAKITEGSVKATADVKLLRINGIDSKLTIGGNSTLELAMNNTTNADLNKILVEEGSNLIVNSNNKIYSITNQGKVMIGSKSNDAASIEAYNFNNQGEARNFGGLIVNNEFINSGSDARFITAGELTVKNNAENGGTIENSSKINVKGDLTNTGIITNKAQGEVVVNSENDGEFINETTGEITNYGDIYTVVDGNTNVIYNYGLINAKEGSLTYITRNSFADEKTGKATNEDGQKMGTIRMDKRDANMSVTEKNYQGYKEYTVNATELTEGVLTAVAKDKFNKIILTDAAELSAEVAAYVKYIKTSGASLTLPSGARIQEATFSNDVEFYCEPKTKITEKTIIAKLTVEKGVKLTIPTENEMNVTNIHGLLTSKTNAQIVNEGTILVGGNFYTTLDRSATKNANPTGVFASGDGYNTAFHWSHQF